MKSGIYVINIIHDILLMDTNGNLLKIMNCNRCYIRGLTTLGIFNTIIGCLFNRVLCVIRDTENKKTIRRYFDKADRWPPEDDS